MNLFRTVAGFFCASLCCNICFSQNFQLEFAGEATLPSGYKFDSVELGGLSGISYDATNDLFYVISDDYSNIAPARFYTFKIDLSDGRLDSVDVMPAGMQFLKDTNDQPFVRTAIDAEGIAFSRNGIVYISSEGSADTRHKPFIRKFSLDGHSLTDVALPPKFLPNHARDIGIRKNRGPENLSLSPDERFLFTANEQALSQDGPATGLGVPSPARIVQFDLEQEKVVGEYLYWVGPVVLKPNPPSAKSDNGLTDLIALSPTRLLALERSYSRGAGNAIRLYEVSLQNAENIAEIYRLDKVDVSKIQPARKTLLFDLLDLGIQLDNSEGLTFGPRLPDGRLSLLLVSDNNFSTRQVTQFLAFAVADQSETYLELSIGQIQGTDHISPFRGSTVSGVTGIVTAISEERNQQGFWFQSETEDEDIATSEGVFVSVDTSQSLPQSGDKVSVTGSVSEKTRKGQLSRTVIISHHFDLLSRGHDLPAPVVLGVGGRLQPTAVIDDDRLTHFEPQTDGIDFYESLEGMRVSVNNPVVVGPKNRYGECVVLADRGRTAGLRTQRGGILLRADDPNPERIFVRGSQNKPLPDGNIGDHFVGKLTGIMDYSFSNYKVVAQTVPPMLRGVKVREATALKGEKNWLAIVTYNVENLDALDDSTKFERIARNITINLGAPDILALQEVQDDSGPTDDGIVTAQKTMSRLIETIKIAGGPHYRACQIDPENKADGGQPGGNIRVAYLYNPKRVTLNRKGDAGPRQHTTIDENGGLSQNPGRISPMHEAFARSRKVLAAEFTFNGRKIVVLNCHFNSKGGDTAVFGAKQPPVHVSAVRRVKQAGLVVDFVDAVCQQDPAATVIVAGDMNEHEFRRPMQVLAGENLVNLVTHIPVTDRYTYVYEGNSQVLDHIFLSKHLVESGRFKVDAVHINAEYAHTRRASDHDPIVALIKMAGRNNAGK